MCRRPTRKRPHNQACGRSLGEFSCKSHLKTAIDGLPLDFRLTGGEVSDYTQRETLARYRTRNSAAPSRDQRYDPKAILVACSTRGILPVIRLQSSAKVIQKFFLKTLCRGQDRFEEAIGKLEWFKRVAPRCKKTAEN